MREVVVLSGKGGTGKTSLTAAFSHVAGPHVLCDLDVDAPDLHLLARPEVQRRGPFLSGQVAVLDAARCQDCGACVAACAFGAIVPGEAGLQVDPGACEGCRFCEHVCPSGAFAFEDRLCGTWYFSESRLAPMVHAQLDPGQENSGRLVSLLKGQARQEAQARGLDLILSDGSPGVGCPVISSLSQASLALLVTEPSPSGLHDLQRIAELCRHFRIPVQVIVNRADLAPEACDAIVAHCEAQGLPLLGRLPFDPAVVEAQVAGRTLTEPPSTPLADEIRRMWQIVETSLDALQEPQP